MSKEQKEQKEEIIYTSNLKEMIRKVNSEPKKKMIFSGIKENSVGFVFGPAKSGKTIYCENLGLSIAAGLQSYLDKPIEITNRKVLMISLEEFYPNRTERNEIQIAKLLQEKGEEWINNYIVVNEKLLRYVVCEEDWSILNKIIIQNNPGLVIIDSLSRLHSGNIEESRVAKELMKNLREMANNNKTTIICIHHTPKLLDSTPLTINTIAGSRIIAQDADFVIGINKTTGGERYMKDVAFRYADDNSETVCLMKLNNDLWLEKIDDIEESKLLISSDGRYNDQNQQQIYLFLVSKSDINNGEVDITEIKDQFKELSPQSIHNQLKALISQGKVVRLSQGRYKAVV